MSNLLIKVFFLTITLYLIKSDTSHTLHEPCSHPKYNLRELQTNHPFYQDISLAIEFIKKKEWMLVQPDLKLTEEERWGAISIVLPELIRWNALQDIMETTALELLYVEKGKDGADFSIGYFQMKPSFIENLENYVLTNRDGVSHPVGTDGRNYAAASPHINHWVIGCGAVAQFDSSNSAFFNIQTGSLSVLCLNVQ